MVHLEPLIVGAVAGLVDVEQRHDQAGAVGVTANAAGGLDVFGAGFRLAQHDHEAKPDDVQADGNHVGGQGDVHAFVLVERQGQAALGGGDIAGGRGT